MIEVTNSYGKTVVYEAAEQMFDDDLREELHIQLAPCSEQLFFDEYCRRHEQKFGEPFALDTENPVF